MTAYTVAQVLNAARQGLSLGPSAVVQDASATVLANLDALAPIASAGTISAVDFTDTSRPVLSIPSSQYTLDTSIISLFQGSYAIDIPDATVASAPQFVGKPNVSVAIVDTAANIQANIGGLQTLSSSGAVASITVEGGIWGQPGPVLTLTAAQLTADPLVVAELMAPGNTRLNSLSVITVAGTLTLSQAIAAEASNPYITGLTVADTAADAAAGIATMIAHPHATPTSFQQFYMGSNAYSFSSISITDQGSPFFNVTEPDYNPASVAFQAITGPFTVNITGLTIANISSAEQLPVSSHETLKFAVSDNAANIEANIDLLESLLLANRLASITVTDTSASALKFTASQQLVDAGAIAMVQSSSSGLTINGAVGGQTASSQTAVAPFSGVTIADTNTGVTEYVTVTLSTPANGTLSNLGGGIYTASAGLYGVSGSVASVTAALDGLVFTPTAGLTGTTTFTINVADQAGLSASNNTTTVSATAPSNPGLIPTLNISQQLELIYIAYFNRAAEGAGFAFWSGQNVQAQASGESASTALSNIANSFTPQPETIAIYPFLANTSVNLSTPAAQAGLATFIANVYQNLFDRTEEQAGAAYWVGQITSGAVGLSAAALAIANGATGTDATEMQNKITVALDFTTRTNAAGLEGTGPSAPNFNVAAFDSAVHTVLNGVDGISLNDASVTAGENATTAYIASATGGGTLTLASGGTVTVSAGQTQYTAITITGSSALSLTNGSTAITAINGSAATGNLSVSTVSLQSPATISGGSGNDTLNATLATGAVKMSDGSGNDTLQFNGAVAGNVISIGNGSDLVQTQSFAASQGLSYIAAADVSTNTALVSDLDVLNGYTAGSTRIDLNGLNASYAMTSVSASAIASAVTGAGSLLAATQAVAALMSAKTVAAFAFGGDEYIYQAKTGGSFSVGDGLLKVAGAAATFRPADLTLT